MRALLRQPPLQRIGLGRYDISLNNCPGQGRRRLQVNRLQIRRSADHLPVHSTRFFDQDWQAFTNAAGLKISLLLVEEGLQALKPV